MVDRKRRPLAENPTEDAPGRGGQQGSGGGDIARDIGSRDELKRATERPGGATRVEGKDKDRSDSPG